MLYSSSKSYIHQHCYVKDNLSFLFLNSGSYFPTMENYGSLLIVCMIISTFTISFAESMSDKEIIELREESKDMFYHAYNAYLFNAFPADELMPLSCQGNLSFT